MSEESPSYSRVWGPIVHAMVQSGASGQEWAVLVALLRWQREGSNILSMSVPTICKYTGLDEDTVRHRLSSLSKRYRTALYALCVPRLGPEDGSNMLTRKERVEWEKRRGDNGNA